MGARALSVCPQCGFHLKQTVFGPSSKPPSSEELPDPAAARAAESAARQRATDATLRKLRKAAQSAPPTPEQMAELRALRQKGNP